MPSLDRTHHLTETSVDQNVTWPKASLDWKNFGNRMTSYIFFKNDIIHLKKKRLWNDFLINAFEALEPILDPQLDDFVLYIENSYIGKRQARWGGIQNLRCLIERWNVHDRTLAGTGRTNNSVEGKSKKMKKKSILRVPLEA